MKLADNPEATPAASPHQTATAEPKAEVSRFHAVMPHIPGVTPGTRASNAARRAGAVRAALLVGAIVLVGGGAAWRALRTKQAPAETAVEYAASTPLPADLPPANPARPRSTNEIGALGELAHPWSAKKFSYSRPVTHEEVPAIAIRLPGGNGKTSASYWAILLKAPFGQCELEYISDVNEVASRFGYAAKHPMIVDACSGTLYDPLRTGTLPNGSWARGDIVQGAGFRPPMQIEVRVDGDRLVAGRSEN